MSHLSTKELDLYSNKILEDYDNRDPSVFFKEKIKISNEDALIIQSNDVGSLCMFDASEPIVTISIK